VFPYRSFTLRTVRDPQQKGRLSSGGRVTKVKGERNRRQVLAGQLPGKDIMKQLETASTEENKKKEEFGSGNRAQVLIFNCPGPRIAAKKSQEKSKQTIHRKTPGGPEDDCIKRQRLRGVSQHTAQRKSGPERMDEGEKQGWWFS